MIKNIKSPSNILILISFLLISSATASDVVHQQLLQPEHNPWEEKGIPSTYTFGAYYTCKQSDERWHSLSFTDEYADIMVRFDNQPQELVFWRGSSYLPYWKTKQTKLSFSEMVPRSGDGPQERPDKVNRYSQARIIESSSERVVIHWRYMPKMPLTLDWHHLPDQTQMTDEYFVIFPDRSVVRSVLQGQSFYEDWRKTVPGRISRYQLTDEEVQEKQVRPNDTDLMYRIMGFSKEKPQPVKRASVHQYPETFPKPLVNFTFDEASGRAVKDTVSGTMVPIEGSAVCWREGISGTALQMDGWETNIELDKDLTSQITKSITLDAWVALAAYPWNTTPIVQQIETSDHKEGNGFYLGLNAEGKPVLWVTVMDDKGPRHIRLEAEKAIPRRRWSHITGVVELTKSRSHMRLYIDGQMVNQAESDCPNGTFKLAKKQPLRIGYGVKKNPAFPVGRLHLSQYALDGLIDEVRVYNQALSDEQILASNSIHAELTEEKRCKPDIGPRKLPKGDEGWKNFGAHFTHLQFHESWDKMYRMSGHPDLVVSFDKNPGRYVLWHGAGYVPMLVTENGLWYNNEFNEGWGKDGGCEPMADKKAVFGQVHILEQSPARVVIKWRYPLSGLRYDILRENPKTGWGEWADWYLTIYPDGTIVKRMRVYMAEKKGHEWHESMAIMGPEQRPDDVLEKQDVLTLATLNGQVRRYSWIDAPPTDVDYKDMALHIVNMKSRFDPYTIQRAERGNIYKLKEGNPPYSVFPAWNHWPVSHFLSGGRYAIAPDHAAHCSLTHVYWKSSTNFGEKGLYEEKHLLEGLSDKTAEELIPLTRSWLNPAQAEALSKDIDIAYNAAQRSYEITRQSSKVQSMKLKLLATEASPIINPVFVITNWGADKLAQCKINGKRPKESIDLRQGIVPQANGVNALVVWMELTATDPMEIEIRF